MHIFANPISLVLVTAGSLVLTACTRTEEPKTFEDCILQKTPTAKTSEALALVKAACKGKFPKVFDFDAIASGASVSAWREVALKPEFLGLPDAEKSEARKQYFERVVLPRIDQAYIEEARAQFDAFARKSERSAPSSASAASAAAKP